MICASVLIVSSSKDDSFCVQRVLNDLRPKAIKLTQNGVSLRSSDLDAFNRDANGEYVEFRVQDSGGRIIENTLAMIFQAFRKVAIGDTWTLMVALA